ncbi:MAG: hypothetical protein MJ142_06530 [Clostridia bacterium]|nr:hypothetical protein [Clostridia bacterium]
MNHDEYLRGIILRGNELELLDRAAEKLPARHTAVRGIIAAAAALLTVLLPAAGAAHVFF